MAVKNIGGNMINHDHFRPKTVYVQQGNNYATNDILPKFGLGRFPGVWLDRYDIDKI
jgi:hypothetical protein